MRRGGSQPSRLRLPSEFSGLIWGGNQRIGRVLLPWWEPRRPQEAHAYPPQADGLHPLHGAHIEDIYAVVAIHRDVGGAAT